MITGRLPLPFYIFLLQFQIHVLHLTFTSPANASPFEPILQDVLKAISVSQKWDLGDVSVSKLDVGKVRFGISRRYEFRFGFGKNQLLFNFSDQVRSWSKFRKPKSNLGSLINQVSTLAVLDAFILEGPFELRVDGLHQLSLSLPAGRQAKRTQVLKIKLVRVVFIPKEVRHQAHRIGNESYILEPFHSCTHIFNFS